MEQIGKQEWVAQCSRRLREHWRTLDVGCLEGVSEEIWRDEQLRSKPPQVAAVEWLRQGIPMA